MHFPEEEAAGEQQSHALYSRLWSVNIKSLSLSLSLVRCHADNSIKHHQLFRRGSDRRGHGGGEVGGRGSKVDICQPVLPPRKYLSSSVASWGGNVCLYPVGSPLKLLCVPSINTVRLGPPYIPHFIRLAQWPSNVIAFKLSESTLYL